MEAPSVRRGFGAVRGSAACVILLALPSGQAQEGGLPGTRFEGYPGAPAIHVVAREEEMTYFPCSQCHQMMPPNPEVRELQAPHVSELEHGRGRMWCLTCHHGDDREQLRTLLDEQVDFDDAHLVCGSCHANRHRDWYFGAHGKRVARWQGERVLYGCPHCHDPHEPAIAPRAPEAPPPVRLGLERPAMIHRPAAGPRALRDTEEEQPGEE